MKPPKTRSARPPRADTRFAAIVCGVVACLMFVPALGFDFVRDDRELLLEGSLLRAAGTLARLVASDYWSVSGGESGLWRPFVTFTLWLDGRLSGWSPAWFHAANLLAHGLATFLLVSVVAACGGGVVAGWLAGLWFAAMPAHVESVAWVAGRTDAWCAVFALAALRMARGSGAARGSGPAAWALALLSKESAAAVAPVFALAALHGTPPRSAARGARAFAWRAFAPYALVLAAWAVLHVWIAGAIPTGSGAVATGSARLWTALALPAWELRFLLPGVGHGPDWMIAPLTGASTAALFGLVLHACAAVALARLAAARDVAALPLAILWLPLAGMSALALARGIVVSGERHIYLASAGAAWAAGVWLERMVLARTSVAGTGVAGQVAARAGTEVARATPAAPGPRPARRARVPLLALAAALVAWSAADTIAALPAWRNEESMYAAMARTQPRNAVGPLGLALVRVERGDDAGAWEALARAATIDSTRYEIPLYRAGILLRRGEAETARALAVEAGIRVGWNRDAALIQALALQRLGRWTEARPVLEDLRARSPGDPDVAAAWSTQLARESRPDHTDGSAPR